MSHKSIEVVYWIDNLLDGNQSEKDFKEELKNAVNKVGDKWDVDIQINDEYE